MKLSTAWSIQAASDYAAAQIVLDRKTPSTYCQAIAKCQQCVEKNVKAAVRIFVEQGVIKGEPKDRGHALDKSLKVLRARLRATGTTHDDLTDILYNVLREHEVGEALALCRLAPSYPADGERFVKNTEYPFNL